jgi:hypothetical protein
MRHIENSMQNFNHGTRNPQKEPSHKRWLDNFMAAIMAAISPSLALFGHL